MLAGRRIFHLRNVGNRLSSSRINQETILNFALKRVPVSGWTEESLAGGAVDAGLPALSHKIISRGPVELVEYFLRLKRDSVNARLTTGDAGDVVSNEEPGEQRLQRFIIYHLEHVQQSGLKASWPSALALLADPSNAQSALGSLIDFSGDLCNAVGVVPSRLDWYTERFALISLYSASEMFFLTDKSEVLTDTKDFVMRSSRSYTELRKDPSITAGLKACAQTMQSFIRNK